MNVFHSKQHLAYPTTIQYSNMYVICKDLTLDDDFGLIKCVSTFPCCTGTFPCCTCTSDIVYFPCCTSAGKSTPYLMYYPDISPQHRYLSSQLRVYPSETLVQVFCIFHQCLVYTIWNCLIRDDGFSAMSQTEFYLEESKLTRFLLTTAPTINQTMRCGQC